MIADKPQLDPKDGMALRVYLEALRSSLDGEYSTWFNHYVQLAAVFAPRSPQWNYDDVDQGWRRDQIIMNATGILDLRILKAGMLTGLSNPSQLWINLVCPRTELDQKSHIRQYLEAVRDKVLSVFAQSNVYETLLQAYGDEGLYGTTAFFIEEDPITKIRCHPYPIGSYRIGGGSDLRVDLLMRTIPMTVNQIVTTFGYKNCSDAVRVLYDSNAGGVKQEWRTVVHVVTKNTYYSVSNPLGEKPWMSVYYELEAFRGPDGKTSTFNAGILRRDGYTTCPFVVGRWLTYGENFYGESPCMDILGDNLGVQSYEEKIAMAVEKMMDPPMLAGSAMDARKLSCLPGDVVVGDEKEGQSAFKPIYQIKFEVRDALGMVERAENRIHEGLYRNVFQAIGQTKTTQPRTAEEIRALQEEQLAVLGPVVERNIGDIHEPLVLRTLDILQRRGELPKMPFELMNIPIKIEFQSVLVKAAKLSQAGGIDRLIAFCGNEAAVQQGTMDIVNWDEATRKYAELVGVPNKMLNTEEQVQKMRADRQYQQQQAQQADNAQKLAQAAGNLAGADTQGKNALTALAPQLSRTG